MSDITHDLFGIPNLVEVKFPASVLGALGMVLIPRAATAVTGLSGLELPAHVPPVGKQDMGGGRKIPRSWLPSIPAYILI